MANHTATNNTGSDLACADTLWKSVDALRGLADAAEYRHAVLGLLFLKYISVLFDARLDQVKAELEGEGITGPQLESLLENRDEYAWGQHRKLDGPPLGDAPLLLLSR